MKLFSSSPLFKAWSQGRPGFSAGLFYAMMGIVGVWSSGLLFVPAVVDATLQRMHLATSSFPAFAAQQISPAMYNFANQGWRAPEDVTLEQWNARNHDPGSYFNHFPVRNLTWFERDQVGPAGLWGYYRSRFQGRELHTKYRLEPSPEGGWNVIRVESKFSDELH